MGLVLVSSPISGAAQLADLALIWNLTAGAADLARNGTDLATDAGLTTAVLLSMFLDRRAEAGDVPPSGDAADLRGWWADQFNAVEGDRYGSRLWLLDRAKATNETALRAKQYTLEALQWMVDDQVAAVDVTSQLVVQPLPRRVLIGTTLTRPGAAPPLSFRFAHVWDAMAS